MLADWYSRVVFAVIAVTLATLAGQGACTVEPVARAQSVQCGSTSNPCYVRLLALERVLEDGGGVGTDRDGLRAYVVNRVRTTGD